MSASWHWFQFQGRVWLLDVPSSSLFEIDRPTAAVLDWMEAHPGDNLPSALAGVDSSDLSAIAEEIADWRRRGLLCPEQPVAVPNRSPQLKAMCLHVAHDCNLRCRYCFGQTGAFGGERALMSAGVGLRAIDLLLRESGSRDRLEVDFFGGEPLMNMTVVHQIIDYGREQARRQGKTIHFTLTTNALALNEPELDFLNRNAVSLVLSHDGRPSVHNRMRPLPGGGASSDSVLERIARAVKSRGGKDYYLRGTFTRHNLDFASDVRFFYEQGFRIISVEPVIATDDAPYAIRRDDLPAIFAEYDRLAEYCLERAHAGDPFTFFHFAVDLDHGPCVYKRLAGCGAGHEYLAVTPQGDLYPCHQFVGRASYRMGHVERGIERTDLRTRFGQADIYHKQGCAECWARYFCSGGCHANADLMNGDILKPDVMGCALLKKRLECALGMKAVLAAA